MPGNHPRVAELIASLQLGPHPEGGFYREIFRSSVAVTPPDGRGTRSAQTVIHFLLPEGHFSRWHRVTSDETWLLEEGGPLELLELAEPGLEHVRHALEEPDPSTCATIPAGHWQAARSLGDYALVRCTVMPGFEFADFRLLADDDAATARVRERWPELLELL